jgi:predicted nucleic acid-binding protein
VAEAQTGVLYVDTSALVKLVIREAETEVLEEALRSWSDLATSVVTSIELSRAVARASTDSTVVVAHEYTLLGVLASVAQVPLSDDVRATAASLGPVELRTLDAIHLASALALVDDLAGILIYDSRMQRAAVASGVPVLASEPAPVKTDDQPETTD